ncbi:hypothetical protein [Streptococcus anginosus]|uniref:hypothetical protein n=1 Tax=Streptococcus anginosus TaxID=1328 RepID=UPI001957C758|nr:hypothetical protein [Streptococcus anginosus]VTY17730.1 Uncharacterised protein [Streptococcus anginosus]
MSYKVIRPFKDLSDPKQHDYAVGDSFPREGYKPTDTFTNGLLTGANSAGSIFIVVADEESEKQEVAEVDKVSDTTEDTAEATEDSTLTEDAAEEETPAEEETETTEEEVPAEKPKRKRATKKVEE